MMVRCYGCGRGYEPTAEATASHTSHAPAPGIEKAAPRALVVTWLEACQRERDEALRMAGDPDTAAGILAGLLLAVQQMQANAQAAGDVAGASHLGVTATRLQRAAQSLTRATGADALQRDAFSHPVEKLGKTIKENRT